MAKYSSEFTSYNGTDYKVEIITNNSTTIKEQILLSGSPFTTEMDGSKKHLYMPVKTQSATCRILTKGILSDIYSPNAQGTKVILTNVTENKVEWVGFVTPCAFDMGFDNELEEIEIEAIDGLAVLQYIKYTAPKKEIKSFLEIIWNVLKKCKVYKNFYISDNLQFSRNGTESVIEKLSVSESNFFDEKDDKKITDDDVAWDCLEVLEEVCKYLGYTAIAQNEDVYFIDYDAIKANNNNTYFKYSLEGTTPPKTYTSKVTLKHNKTINGKDYAENGSKISLDNVYNKVSVKADNYSFNTVIPDIYDTAYNITSATDPTLKNATFNSANMYGEMITSDTEDGSNKNMIAFIAHQSRNYHAIFMKYYKNPNFTFNVWNSSKQKINIDEMNYTNSANKFGAFLIQTNVNKIETNDNEVKTFLNNWRNWSNESKNKARDMFDNWLVEKGISNLSLQKYIMLLNPSSGHIGNDQITNYPYFETNLTTGASFLGGENCYLLISGSYNFHWLDNFRFPLPESSEDISGNYSYNWGDRNPFECYLLGKLQWGNYYWNGKDWTTTNTTFQMPYVRDSDDRGDFQVPKLAFKDNEFINTVTWRIGTSKKGLLIPAPSKGIMAGQPKFTMYKPYDPKTWWRRHPTAFRHTKYFDKGYNVYPHRCVFLKDFKFEALITDPTYSGAGKSDTVYTNIINADNVNDLQEEKFKINTFDNKQLSYSVVSTKDTSGNYKYTNKLYNKACYNGQQSWSGSDDDAPHTTNGLRSEEHFIYKIVNQYSNPATVYECNLKKGNPIWGLYKTKSFGNKQFIIDSINIDYRRDAENIKLIEKF